jgi:hypothetical protein
MDRQNHSFAKKSAEQRSRNSASVRAGMDKGNVLVFSENGYSFDQCSKHKTDSSFPDSIDMKTFLSFIGRQCWIETAGENGNRISFR